MCIVSTHILANILAQIPIFGNENIRNFFENYLENLSGDIIFKTPGMRFDIPELLSAKESNSSGGGGGGKPSQTGTTGKNIVAYMQNKKK